MKDDQEAREMPLWDHVVEFRSRLIKALVGLILVTLGSYVFWEKLWLFLVYPLKNQSAEVLIITTTPGEGFITSFKVSLIAGCLVSSPWVIWQMWKFLEPALFPKEKKTLVPAFFFSVVLFLTGVSFCFFVVLPYGLKFLAEYSPGEVVSHWRQGEYASFILKLGLAFGLSFQLPVICLVLARLGLVTARGMIYFFRYALVLIFIAAALLTPPDPLSQTLLALPLCLIYGLSILVVKWTARKAEAT